MCRICLLLITCLYSLTACSSIPRLGKEGIVAYGYQNGAPMYDSISIKIEEVPGKIVLFFAYNSVPLPIHFAVINLLNSLYQSTCQNLKSLNTGLKHGN